ncbi:DMT family transporter [Methylocella tundrae]|uniref:Multidrug DMT transporter permease n=1 Tax=Methylocella tundrae TaxID=227605 RepID=A0A4U8Z121_METTU|nr:DMT family transporter [Methylocella tundrae]WPP06301.1 DMT family transporter [Methylocella tundrae]VFU08988.1 Multidrug DMT transporter permease [Methylocella tundrae]
MPFLPPWLWIVFTITAAAAQTLRNAAQRDLLDDVGAAGAAYVRFLYGLPFALLFLGVVVGLTGRHPTPIGSHALSWIFVGALAQVLATGLMLAAMRERSFVVTIAYTKTEPLQVALFGLVFLGDRLTGPTALSIFVATIGVLVLSWPGSGRIPSPKTSAEAVPAYRSPAILGLCAGACFAISAVGFRGAILALDGPTFLVAASTALVIGLLVQTLAILLHLGLTNRPLLRAIAAEWRPSLLAGFLGAFASQFWFLAFAIDSAARVRTLGLVEVIFAQMVSRRLFKQGASPRDALGIAMIVTGVVILFRA